MPTSLHILDLPAAEIAELLEKQGHKVPPSLVPELKLLMHEIYRMRGDGSVGELSDGLEAAA